MWIESHPSLSVRRRFVSPPGYQSPALGDSVPVPGSQEAQHETLQPRVSTPALSRVPQLFASVIPSRTHQEVDNEHRISQWWGHRGLHQHEVLECLTTEETRQVSSKKVNCELTTIPTSSTLLHHIRSRADGISSNNSTEPSLARMPAAFEGKENLKSPSESSIARVPAAVEGDGNLKSPSESSIARVPAASEDYE